MLREREMVGWCPREGEGGLVTLLWIHLHRGGAPYCFGRERWLDGVRERRGRTGHVVADRERERFGQGDPESFLEKERPSLGLQGSWLGYKAPPLKMVATMLSDKG